MYVAQKPIAAYCGHNVEFWSVQEFAVGMGIGVCKMVKNIEVDLVDVGHELQERGQ